MRILPPGHLIETEAHPNPVDRGLALHPDLLLTPVISPRHILSHRRTMQSHKNTVANANPNYNRRRKSRRQPHKEPIVVNPPAVNVQAEGWGSTADPWPGTIGKQSAVGLALRGSYVRPVISDESDISKEIISVWRQNVFAAENGGELQKMEDLYDRLDREREKWNERLNNPLTWGWGGEPDALNDWAKEAKEVTASHGWGDWQPDELNNWTNDPAYDRPHLRDHQPANSDKTPDGAFNTQNREPTPPPLPKLVSSYAEKLKADGRERSYAFAQVSPAAFPISRADSN